jgi:hypothetical protein
LIVAEYVWNDRLNYSLKWRKYCFRYILFPLLVRFLINLLVDVPKLIKMSLVCYKCYLAIFICFWLLMCPVPRLGCDLPSSEFVPYLYPSLTNQCLSFWLTGAWQIHTWLTTNYFPLIHRNNSYFPCQPRWKTDNI